MKNDNLINKEKDNIIQNSFNLNNNSLTYTDSVNVNGSCFQSKNKTPQIKLENGSNNNTYENEENKENDTGEEIILKPPYNDKNIRDSIEEKNNGEINDDNINDILLTNIIKKKRNPLNKKINRNGNISRASIYSVNSNISNRNFRLSEYNNTTFNIRENEYFSNSLRNNRTIRTNYLSPSGFHKKNVSDNKNKSK